MDLCSKRILVTGANGFVGKCLINVLKKQGVYVVGTGRKLVNSKADSFFSIPDFCATVDLVN